MIRVPVQYILCDYTCSLQSHLHTSIVIIWIHVHIYMYLHVHLHVRYMYIVLIIYYLVLSPVNAYSIKTASLSPSLPPSLSLPLSSSIELSSFSTSNRSNTNVVEGGVSFVVTDETNPNWQASRFNFVLPLSTSIDSLHTQVAYDAGMIGLLIQ